MTSSPLDGGLTVALVVVVLVAGFAGGSVGTAALLFDTDTVDATFGTAATFPVEDLLAVHHVLDPHAPTGESWSAGDSSLTWSGDSGAAGTLDVLVRLDAASPASVAVGRDALYDVLDQGTDADLRIARNGSTVLTPELSHVGAEAWFVMSLEPGDHRLRFEAVAPSTTVTTNATEDNVAQAGSGVDALARTMPTASGPEANGTAGGSSTANGSDAALDGDGTQVAGETSLGESEASSVEEATDGAGEGELTGGADGDGTDPSSSSETATEDDGLVPDHSPSPSDEGDDDPATESTDGGDDDGPAGSDSLDPSAEPTDGDVEPGSVEPADGETLDGGDESTTPEDVGDADDDPATDGDQDAEDGDPSTDVTGTSGDSDPDADDGNGDATADATDPGVADGDSADEDSTTEAGTSVDDGSDDDGADVGEQA